MWLVVPFQSSTQGLIEAVDHNRLESPVSRVDVAHDPTHVENALHTSTRLPVSFPDTPAHVSSDISRFDGKFKGNGGPTARYRSQYNPSDDLIQADAENVSRPYSCTICGSQRSYQNHSDWKKHEKEHEATYFCMIGSSQEAPQIINEQTKINSACDFSCKRRDHMVTHLNKCHEIHKAAQARAFADQWRRTTGRKFWSCGFCIRLFVNFSERLKHICSEHYKKDQKYEGWEITKVIKGLLLQPGVQRAWDTILATGPIYQLEEIVWDRRTIEQTQYLLEIGPSPTQSAESLAMAAYKAGKLKSEPPQSASALSITAALGEAVETEFVNPDFTLYSPVSRRPSVERRPTRVASNNTSVANPSSVYWALSTGYMLDELYHEANPSEGQAHMPNGAPSSEYDNSDLASIFESSNAPKLPLSYGPQTFNPWSQNHIPSEMHR